MQRFKLPFILPWLTLIGSLGVLFWFAALPTSKVCVSYHNGSPSTLSVIMFGASGAAGILSAISYYIRSPRKGALRVIFGLLLGIGLGALMLLIFLFLNLKCIRIHP